MSISTNWPVLFCCFSSITYLSGCEFWGPYELMVSFKENSCELGGGGQGVRAFCFSYHVLPPPVLLSSFASRTFVLLCLPTPTLHWVAPVFTIKKLRWKVNHSALSGALTEAAFLWNKFANIVGSRVANRGLRYFPLFSRQIFLTVGRLVSGTVTHGSSGEQNGGHWCSNYGLYFFQILVLCKIVLLLRNFIRG